MQNNLVINGFSTYAKYRAPSDEIRLSEKSAEWMAQHVRLSYYSFQYSKCDDLLCCKPRRSPIEQLLGGQTFLPSPRIFTHKEGKVVLADPFNLPKDYHFANLSETLMYPVSQFIPFDLYNPKVNKNLSNLRCPFCVEQYFGTIAAMKRHRVGFHKYQRYKGDNPPVQLDIQQANLVGAVRILERLGPECRILYEDGREEWHQPPPSHPLLVKYLELNPTELESIYMIPPGRISRYGLIL